MLIPDEKAHLKCDVCRELSTGIQQREATAVNYLVQMLQSIEEGRIDRAGGPSKMVLIHLEGADNLRVIDHWISTEFPGQFPIGPNRITELFQLTIS